MTDRRQRQRAAVSIYPARRFDGVNDEQSRQLADLEDRAEQAVRVVDKGKLGPLTVTDVLEAHYRARVGEFVRVRRAGTDFTVFLPPPSQGIAGQSIIVKDVWGASGTVTIRATAGQVDGSSTSAINSAYEAKHLVCDGENWWST